MYLKSIEMHGFKSFSQKIELDFHNGITGIVGPNGSGKSNIADAVRWVLGEQKTKQLRSTSMQDVIFSGTETRKPQSYAYVALTLDNSDRKLAMDFDEVTVARRVYRSGESEYILNGVTCRLRDVQELFYDTGIGKEGYSIIGQGQIDAILNGKPEDRRELFDEAAGIVKYKRRRTAAQKKLDSEEASLVRVNDILSELERQVGPLKKQSEDARTYLKKREELRTLEINSFLNEMNRLKKESGEIADKMDIASRQKEDASLRYTQANETFRSAFNAMNRLDGESEQLRERLNQTELKEQAARSQILILEEQIRTIESNSTHYESRKQDLEERLQGQVRQRDAYLDEKEALDQELRKVCHEGDVTGSFTEEIRTEISFCEGQIEKNRGRILELLNERADLQAALERCVTMKEQTDIHRASLNSALLNDQTDTAQITSRLKEAEERWKDVSDGVKALEDRSAGIDKKRQEWREKLATARQKRDELSSRYHQAVSRRDSLRNIAERYDGYGNSIRKVMEQKGSRPGIHGVVADLIHVSSEYEIAIETALGGAIQNIVTDDEETAKQMIAFLKMNHFGRATFLPLTAVKAPKNVPSGDVLKEPGIIGLADSLVEADPKYRGIVASLLGRTVVADNIDHAIAVSRKYRQSVRIVTCGGELLQQGGAMTGGAFRNNSNLLGRGREIEDLEKQIQAISQEQKELNSRLEDMETANELLKEEQSELGEQIREAYLKENTARMQLEQVRRDKEQMEAARTDLLREIEEDEARLESIAEEQRQCQEAMAGSEAEEARLGRENERISGKLEDLGRSLSDSETELSANALAQAGIRQKLEFCNENLQRVARELKQLSDESEALTASFGSSEEEIADRRNQIEDQKILIDSCKEDKAAIEAGLAQAARERESQTEIYHSMEQQREDLNAEINETEKELIRLQVQMDKCKETLDEQHTYMWEEYEITYHNAMEYASDELRERKDLKKEITRLRGEIRALGNVNVSAIDEYREVSERYNFMNGQRNDIEEAKNVLIGVIADLNEGMQKQFREKFAEIREEFDKVFKELFGGGKGTLELTEDEDVLESGVRIIAQPPGKKLQNMMQMSGGEKALTAICLLFAIQNLKPSPFWLLDEIEASQDDSNVTRFAKYLHKLTKNTQFIVITHRRGTMIAADRLYGITMQEKGISTLVSVNLIEDKLDA